MTHLQRNLPNALTLLRLVACPAIIHLLQKRYLWLALTLFSIACISDFLDGYLARRLHAISTLGEFLDPLCDRVYCLTLFSLMVTWGICPFWFLGLLITVTLFQSLGYIVLGFGRGTKEPVSTLLISKWNTALQFVWLGILIVDSCFVAKGSDSAVVRNAVYLVGFVSLAVLQIFVFYSYLIRFRMGAYRPQLDL